MLDGVEMVLILVVAGEMCVRDSYYSEQLGLVVPADACVESHRDKS